MDRCSITTLLGLFLKTSIEEIVLCQLFVRLKFYLIINDNNSNIFFMRVTQSNTGFDFRCGPKEILPQELL